MMIRLLALALLTMAANAEPNLLATLMDFESLRQPLTNDTGSVIATPKDGALHIQFAAAEYKPSITLDFDTPQDWSGWTNYHVAVDLENPGDASVQLYLGLVDTHGVFSYRGVSIGAGEAGTFYSIIHEPRFQVDAGIRENPPPWECDDTMFVFRYGKRAFDRSAVKSIELFVRGVIADKELIVDNIRLRKNPAVADDYLKQIVDAFGQNAKRDFPYKIHSTDDLQAAAQVELQRLDKMKPLPDRSRFGGWKNGPKLKATGFFRAEKVNGKWWLVDPEGHLYFANGIANVRTANLSTMTGMDFNEASIQAADPNSVTPVDSTGMVALPAEVVATRHLASPLRRDMFTWLPAHGDELGGHYSYRSAVHMGPVKKGETYSFYRANLERRYGEDDLKTWEQTTLDRMIDWGFTCMGNWVDPAFYPNQRVPYFANGWIIGDFKTLSSGNDVWAPAPDPFDPEFARRAKQTVDIVAKETQGSPWCVGIFIDNEKSWGFREGSVAERYGLILDALSKPAAESPAKAAFVADLKARLKSIEVLNTRWNTSFKSWDAAAAGFEPDAFPEELVADLSHMLNLLAEEYFRVVHGALEAVLPNHLYMGVRMASWGMPDETIQAAVKYTDVLSFNIYQEGLLPSEWAFLNEIDLPTIIGEFHVGAVSDTGLFHPGLTMASDQADRAQMYLDYMESVSAHDMLVGAHWFQYVDSPITGRAYDGESYNVGFVAVTDIPYPEMVQAAKTFNKTLYPRRFGHRGAAQTQNAPQTCTQCRSENREHSP